MPKIVWETVDIKQNARSNDEIFASIGQGRVALNPRACDLIEDIYNYEWADVIQGREGNKVTKLGFRFSNIKGSRSLHVTRRKYKGEFVEGINFNSKSLIKKYFGETKENCTTRHPVEKIDENTLAVDLLHEL